MILGEWMSVSVVLGGMVLLAIIAWRLSPLFGQKGRQAGSLARLGTLALTPQCSIALVRVGQETLVVGLTPQSVSLLAKMNEPVPEEAHSFGKAVAGPLGQAVGNFAPCSSAQRYEEIPGLPWQREKVQT